MTTLDLLPAASASDAVGAWDCTRSEVVQGLYRRLGRAVLLKVERVVKRHDVAQEILQETFAKLWQLGPTFQSERAAFAWVYKASHNLAVDHLRAAFTRTDLQSPERFDQSAARGTGADLALEQRQILARLVARLSEEEANVFLYREVDGMRLEEIATLLEVSTKTVGRILARAEAKLDRAKVSLHETR